jgi:hypothetical protein
LSPNGDSGDRRRPPICTRGREDERAAGSDHAPISRNRPEDSVGDDEFYGLAPPVNGTACTTSDGATRARRGADNMGPPASA